MNYSSFSPGTGGWWRKHIHPVAAMIILTIVMIIVFVMGAVFMREYIKIWSEINKIEGAVMIEVGGKIEKLILP